MESVITVFSIFTDCTEINVSLKIFMTKTVKVENIDDKDEILKISDTTIHVDTNKKNK